MTQTIRQNQKHIDIQSVRLSISFFSSHFCEVFAFSLVPQAPHEIKNIKKKEKGRWTDNESNVTPKSKILLPAMAQPPRPLWSSSSIMFVIISRTIGASPWAQAQTSDVIEYIQLSPSRRRRRGKVFYFIYFIFFFIFSTFERVKERGQKRIKAGLKENPVSFAANGLMPPTPLHSLSTQITAVTLPPILTSFSEDTQLWMSNEREPNW